MRLEKGEAKAIATLLKIFIVLVIISAIMYSSCNAQKLKDYTPSAVFTFLAGASDGLRDASLYRMDGASDFWNGKHSWTNKYKNHDIVQGRAYWGSTSFLVWTTDGAHVSNLLTHQFNGMALAYMPQDNNKKLGHIFLKVLAYNLVRQASHYIVYDMIFKTQGYD